MIANYTWSPLNVAPTSFGLKFEESSKVYGARSIAVSFYIFRLQRVLRVLSASIYKRNVNYSGKKCRTWDLHLEYFLMKK